MPGIYGAVSLQPERQPRALAQAMEGLLAHQSWYARLREEHLPLVWGALSTDPCFQADHRHATSLQAALLCEGTALVVDGRPVPADHAAAGTLLQIYLEDGEDFIHRVGGRFQLAVHDRRTGRLHLWNDRLGFAPIFWYRDDRVFLFAPELKAFLAWRHLDRTLDEASFGAFLARECPFGDGTLLQEVKLLEPASHLVLDGSQVRVESYWRPEPAPESPDRRDAWLEEADHLYNRALDKRIPAGWEGRVVLPLSGGLDSRLLLGKARRHGDRLQLHTHGQPDCTDAVLARQAARTLGLEHRHHLLEMDPEWIQQHGRQAVWLNDGMLNLRNASLIGISEALQPGAVPFLNGIIGAHMSLGVGDFINPDEIRPVTDEEDLRRRVWQYLGVDSGAVFLERMMDPEAAGHFHRLAREQAWRSFQPYRHIELFGDQKMLHTNSALGRRMQGTNDMHRHFFHDLLPFVDEELHALFLRIPLSERLDNRLYQEYMRRYLPDLARVPWSHTGQDLFASKEAIRDSIARRMKRLQRNAAIRRYSFGLLKPRNRDAYNHRELWLRGNTGYRRFMKMTLRDVGATGCPWFEQGRVDALFQAFDRGRDYLLRPLMQVATVVLWHDLFLRQEHPAQDLEPRGE